MKLVTARNQDGACARAAPLLWKKIASTLKKQGTCTLGIVGGRTMPSLLEALAAAAQPTPGSLAILWLDERVDREKNFIPVLPALERLAARGIVTTWHPLVSAEPKEALREARAILDELASPHFDIVVLSAGEDGHIASLFPGNAALQEKKRTYVLVKNAPKPPPTRISVTPTLITSAGAGLLFFVGEKQEAFEQFSKTRTPATRCPAVLAKKIKDLTVFVALS